MFSISEKRHIMVIQVKTLSCCVDVICQGALSFHRIVSDKTSLFNSTFFLEMPTIPEFSDNVIKSVFFRSNCVCKNSI